MIGQSWLRCEDQVLLRIRIAVVLWGNCSLLKGEVQRNLLSGHRDDEPINSCVGGSAEYEAHADDGSKHGESEKNKFNDVTTIKRNLGGES